MVDQPSPEDAPGNVMPGDGSPSQPGGHWEFVPDLPDTTDDVAEGRPPLPAKSKLILGVLATALVVLVAILVWQMFGSSSFKMTGSLTLMGNDNYVTAGTNSGIGANSCSGTRGYSDLAEGAGVTIYGADGKIVGVGSVDYSEDMDGFCILMWTADDVKGGEGPYQYEVSHRGKLTITEDDARAGRAGASIGD